jgi:hypothetical protein
MALALSKTNRVKDYSKNLEGENHSNDFVLQSQMCPPRETNMFLPDGCENDCTKKREH